MQHKGNWENYHQISKTVRTKIGKLVKDGVFDGMGASSSTTHTTSTRQPSKQKRDAANTVVKEEDNREETEVEDDGFPPREYLLQMLGMQNAIVGQTNKSEEPTTTASGGCWDGDTLGDLGFTNLQVGGTGRDAGHGSKDQGVTLAEAGWKVQGVRGTNPLKVKSRIKTAIKSDDVAKPVTTKVTEKPAFVKRCMANLNSAVVLANASDRSAKVTVAKPEEARYTLDRRKLYLDSCITYHYFFTKEFLRNIKNGNMTLTGGCNAGTTVTNARGWWVEFEAWLIEHGDYQLIVCPHA